MPGAGAAGAPGALPCALSPSAMLDAVAQRRPRGAILAANTRNAAPDAATFDATRRTLRRARAVYPSAGTPQHPRPAPLQPHGAAAAGGGGAAEGPAAGAAAAAAAPGAVRRALSPSAMLDSVAQRRPPGRHLAQAAADGRNAPPDAATPDNTRLRIRLRHAVPLPWPEQPNMMFPDIVSIEELRRGLGAMDAPTRQAIEAGMVLLSLDRDVKPCQLTGASTHKHRPHAGALALWCRSTSRCYKYRPPTQTCRDSKVIHGKHACTNVYAGFCATHMRVILLTSLFFGG